MCLGTDPSGRAIYGGDLLPLYLLGLRVRIPPGASIGLINVVYSQPSLRRADPSPRGVLPSCVCVCVISNPPTMRHHTQKGKCLGMDSGNAENSAIFWYHSGSDHRAC